MIPLAAFGFQNYYTEADFVKIPKIDAQVRVSVLNHVMEEQAITNNFCLMSLNTDGEDMDAQLQAARYSVQHYPGKVTYAATFRFDSANWNKKAWLPEILAQLNSNIQSGAVAVKIGKNIGLKERDSAGNFIMISDAQFDAVIDYIEAHHLTLAGHCGEPKNCWLPVEQMTVDSDKRYFSQHPEYYMFLHPEYPSYQAQLAARDSMLAKHPKLKYVGCHLGSVEWSVDELAKTLDRFPNMAVDMAARVCHLQLQSAKDREKVRNFIIKYQDRIIYGSDLTAGIDDGFAKYVRDVWESDWNYFVTDAEMSSPQFEAKFAGLKLPKDVIDKIFRLNAQKWYGLK